MWVFLLSIFVLMQGTSAEIDCQAKDFKECDFPKLFSYIPNELSEFNALCPELTAFLSCLRVYQDSCEGMEYFRSLTEYNSLYRAFGDLCKEGTLFNTVVKKHLKCFNSTFSTTSCPEKMKIITGPYREEGKSVEDDDDYYLPMSIMCLQDILESSCIVGDLGENCGQDVVEATLEFLRRTNYIEEYCDKSNAENLLKNVDDFILTDEQKEILIAKLNTIIISQEKKNK